MDTIAVDKIVMFTVGEDYFANGSVTFRRSDFTGTVITVDVTVSIDPQISVRDLHQALIQKARTDIENLVKMSAEQIEASVHEGLRGGEDYDGE